MVGKAIGVTWRQMCILAHRNIILEISTNSKNNPKLLKIFMKPFINFLDIKKSLNMKKVGMYIIAFERTSKRITVSHHNEAPLVGFRYFYLSSAFIQDLTVEAKIRSVPIP